MTDTIKDDVVETTAPPVARVVAKADKVQGQVNEIAAQVRKIKSWLEKVLGMDIDGDGAVGGSRISALVVTAILCAGIVIAGSTTQYQTYNGDAVHGTFKVVDDGAGTATLTVDAISVSTLTTTTDTAAGDWDVTTNLTVGGTATITGATDLNAASTATNLTLDAGATLAANNGIINATNSTVNLNGTSISGSVDATGAWQFIAAIGATNITMDAGSTFSVREVIAGGVAGFNGIVTNLSHLSTNIVYYYEGIVTNVTTSP